MLGADYRGLGVVRSLGRRGIPVWVLTQPGETLAAHSRYARRALRLPAEPDARADALLELGDEIGGWALVPTTDEDAALVARNRERLAERFTLTSPGWESLRWAYDKRWTYRLGDDCGIECPWTAQPRDREELASLDVPFPAILKPAVKTGFNRLTAAKAWRVDDRRELLERYDEACGLVAADVLLVQELVPGDGGQYSHAALCRDGEPLATITARRTRQYPADFGRASTFVETIDDPETAEQAAAVFARMQLTGLAEVEFKRDERDGRLKLLDINPRVWGWHTLGAAAGVDFPYLLWQLVSGEDVPRVHARTGVRWLRLSTDLPTAVTEVAHRRMSAAAYLRSLHGPRESAIRSRDDPVPGLLELPLLAGTLARRLAGGAGV
ncbi:MAG: D-aspartate ligase [Gaiellaceae bacterium]|nr:D-aspartate ligase [Gaiellaceae bacterium]MDX6471763.1 D-aspartate ligase [Gaiellaceae bacterium]